MKIYNRIALLRTDAGISRKELAERVEVNYQTIGYIERGDYQPSLELAFKFADAFNVSVTQVFSNKPFKSLFDEGDRS